MTFDPAAPPFTSLRSPSDAKPIDDALRLTGLTVDELASVGMIASYAGRIEDHLAWILRWLIGGATSQTWIMTRELMSAGIIERIREVMKLPEWQEFAERWKVETLLRGVKDGMEDRNRVLHGGVNAGSLLDKTLVGYSARRSRDAMAGRAFDSTHVMPRTELQEIAVRIWALEDVLLGFHYEVMLEVHERAGA